MNKVTPYLVLAFALFPGSAGAVTAVFTLTPYNAFTFNNFTDTADYGGGLAVGGSLTIGGTAVGSNLLGESITQFPGQYLLVAGMTLTATNGQMDEGNAYGGGPNNDFTLTQLNGGQFFQGPATADPISFGAQQTYFQNLSTTLSKMTSTGTCTAAGSTTTCTALASGLNIINVSSAATLGTGQTVNINLGTNSYVVINVAGTTDTMSASGFNIYLNGVNQGSSNGDSTTTLAHNVLFNYYQASGLGLASVVGSVLAPLANVSGTQSGQIDGNLVANSFNGQTEFHNFGFEDILPSPAPEPASYLVVGAGLIGFGFVRKRRARR